MVQQSRQRLATFRNTVTYLMIILQSRLQKKEIEPEAAAEVISVIMEECVKFDTADLAHLLFRASLNKEVSTALSPAPRPYSSC